MGKTHNTHRCNIYQEETPHMPAFPTTRSVCIRGANDAVPPYLNQRTSSLHRHATPSTYFLPTKPLKVKRSISHTE